MKFLIVKCSSLGDIIQTFPVVSYLKQKYPDCQVDWIVEKPFAELVEANPQVNKVLKVDSKKWRRGIYLREMMAFKKELTQTPYDVIFDLQGNMKSGLFTWLASSSKKVGFGRKTVFEWPNLLATNKRIDPPSGENVREEYLSVVKTYFEDELPFHAAGISLKISDEQQKQIKHILKHPHLAYGKKVMVCPGAAWKNKRITQESLLLFLQMMHQKEPGAFIFAWGNDEERHICQMLMQAFPQHSVVINRLPLAVLQQLMKHMSLIIAMDSLPLHLAGSTGVSTFSFFGPSSLMKYKPTGMQHRGFQGSCPYGMYFERRCSKLRTCPTGACLREVSGKDLYNAFLTIDREPFGDIAEKKPTWRRLQK